MLAFSGFQYSLGCAPFGDVPRVIPLHVRMANEIASNLPAFFLWKQFIVAHNNS